VQLLLPHARSSPSWNGLVFRGSLVLTPTHKPTALPAAPLLELAFPYTKQIAGVYFEQSPVASPRASLSFLKAKSVMTFWNMGCITHTVALPFTLKSILRQKKNYGNSNISACKNIIFKKSSKRNQNPSRHYNSETNLKFQHKPKYIHLSKILI